ncbi:MAG: hypothetical protein JXB88_00905 [Spirochaetales bacterium]|nr:hypothetical protein [Spirochaetales bacterium]
MYDYDDTSKINRGWPDNGEDVPWIGYIKNWSSSDHDIEYRWALENNSGTIVDTLSGSVTVPALDPSIDINNQGVATVDFSWTWTMTRHTLTLDVDTANAVSEFQEGNNSLEIFTDALTVAFYVEPDTALIHYVENADVGIKIEFYEPHTLSGFRVAVAGCDFCEPYFASYYWKVEKGNSWDGPLTTIMEGYETTAEGPVNIPFPAEHTAKVFKITADRNNGDGVVHILELIPLF